MNEPLEITPKVVVPASDLSWEFMRASGPGGQHVNKTDTAVRLRFALESCEALDEGAKGRIREARRGLVNADGSLTVACESHRSRRRNMMAARERLAALILEHLEPPPPRRPTRPTRASKERRIDAKKKRGAAKQGRRPVTPDREG
ncbi:MAG: aminoacyl-tRNA hydrolase [Deltaproteobacteria bacterium]|nr:aminoacyl-tRNA hydrolase [Deltaproteobacteria bacterium]